MLSAEKALNWGIPWWSRGGKKKHRTQRQIPQGRYWIVYNALCGRITCKSNYYVTYMNTHIYAYLNILSIYGLMK